MRVANVILAVASVVNIAAAKFPTFGSLLDRPGHRNSSLTNHTLPGSAFSTFICLTEVINTLNLTFSINVANDSSNIYFHLQGPMLSPWIGIGFGEHMEDSLMFLMYPSARPGSDGNREPAYAPSINYTMLPGSGIHNGMMEANIVCHNCRSWKGGKLEVDSTQQPFMFAAGAGSTIAFSDSPTASLRQHVVYGSFSMDLVEATGPGGLPRDWTFKKGSRDHMPLGITIDWSPYFHALVMAGTFAILLPLGVIYQRIFNKVRLHIVNQTLGVFLITLGLAAGVKVSNVYIRTRSYRSAHQIIGIITCILIYMQLLLGFMHHRRFQAAARQGLVTFSHVWAGQLIIFLGVFNGALGLRFADAKRSHIFFYIFVVIFMSLLYLVLALWTVRKKRKEAVYNSPASRNFANAQDRDQVPPSNGVGEGETWEMQRQRREHPPTQ